MKRKQIDYEELVNSAKTSAEMVAAFKRMTDDAENISIIPSKLYQGAFELFFIGLAGVDTSFIIFKEEKLAKRFMVNEASENNVIFVVIDGTIYYVPYANSH